MVHAVFFASTDGFNSGAYAIGKITDEERFDVVRHACPGAGACGGMYTANTMSSALEALGMSLPYSSSTPALYPGQYNIFSTPFFFFLSLFLDVSIG